MKSSTYVSCLFLTLLFTFYCSGQTVSFELQGSDGPGLTAANEPSDNVVNGGSGDIGKGGVFVDLSANTLFVDVVWGSGNGFTDLSSDIDFMNIHGPTSINAPNNFFESAETFTGLNGFDPSASNGGYIGETSFEGNMKRLFEGRFYIHLHTFKNGGGEARGYFIPEVVLGDVSGDGLINLLDVAPFIDAISNGAFIDAADTNRDGFVNLLDVDPFVLLLAN